MKNIDHSNLTLEEAIEMPEYAHFREVVEYLDNNPFEVVFPKKFEISLKRFNTNKLNTGSKQVNEKVIANNINLIRKLKK